MNTFGKYIASALAGIILTVAVTFAAPTFYARITGLAPVPVEDLVTVLHFTDALLDRASRCQKGSAL